MAAYTRLSGTLPVQISGLTALAGELNRSVASMVLRYGLQRNFALRRGHGRNARDKKPRGYGSRQHG